MTKKFQILHILIYYDVPQSFIAIDEARTKYLCLLMDNNENELNYIATAISDDRLADFTNGIVNLKDIFELSETNEWYFIKEVDAKVFDAILLDKDILSTDYFLKKITDFIVMCFDIKRGKFPTDNLV